MKKLILLVVVLLVAGAVFAGEGKSCDRNAAKTVQLTGTIEVQGDAEGDARVFRVSDSNEAYSICDKSTADLAKLSGATVRVSGKLVSCDKGQELVIEKAAKI